MLKLYRMNGDVLEYWEAWITATDVTLHWGRVGEEGETRELPHEAGLHPSEIVEREAKPFRAAGFKERKVNQLHSVVVQYRIDGHGTPSDLDRRVQVEELMNECLG
jgi:predicted DNA-binding WGR domain protein